MFRYLLITLILILSIVSQVSAQWWAYLPIACPITGTNKSHTIATIIPEPLDRSQFETILTDAYTQATSEVYQPLEITSSANPYCHFTDEKYAYIYFTDIYQSPFKSAIKTLIKYCIVRGRGNSYQRFYPGYNITDEEFVKILTKSLTLSDRVRQSDQGDPQWSDKYYDKALELKLINKLPDQKVKHYGISWRQAYILWYEGLKLTGKKGMINRYSKYYKDPILSKQYLTRWQTAQMVVDILGWR